MDSALSPRDIQARIRAGASVDDVAALAGVPVERIDAFAAPVLAERHHVAGLAQTNPVRGTGETKSNRILRTAMVEQLVARGVDMDEVEWDSCLLGNRRWKVTASFTVAGEPVVAEFIYDVPGRFSVADNDVARQIIGDGDEDQDAELTVELPPVVVEATPTTDRPFEAEDAYSEPNLAEVDGVYDIVPGDNSNMDALYDMLASFDEDSVKIYTGLVHPESSPDDDPTPVATTAAERRPAKKAPEEPQAEPEQPSLVDDVSPAPPRKTARRQRRASVPSWDEIMFGSPTKGSSDR